MRKILSLSAALLAMVILFTGCGNKPKEAVLESPVTIEQVNTEGKYAARAFVESLFRDDRQLFEACYPAGFIDSLNSAAGVDVYEQYKGVMTVSGEFLGTGFADYREYTVDNGYDEAFLRSRITNVTGFEYSQVGQIQLQKITLFFRYGEEEVNTDFYIIVYEVQGSWYVLESINAEKTF